MGGSIYLIVLAVGALGIFLLDRGSAIPAAVEVPDRARPGADDDELEYRPPRRFPTEAIKPAIS